MNPRTLNELASVMAPAFGSRLSSDLSEIFSAAAKEADSCGFLEPKGGPNVEPIDIKKALADADDLVEKLDFSWWILEQLGPAAKNDDVFHPLTHLIPIFVELQEQAMHLRDSLSKLSPPKKHD